MENSYWQQRAKIFWYKDGDKNKKYFDLVASNRRRKNGISSLINNDGLRVSKADMHQLILDYFSSLFHDDLPLLDVSIISKRIFESEGAFLNEDLSMDEFCRALF